MPQAIAPDRGQQFLFPPALEDWVPADHPARFLREFVDQLDLPALGFAVPVVLDGRPPYAPGLLLVIWLYGYFHKIRATRQLEIACGEHLSLIWLTGMIQPDHNTLWRFWRDHKKALRAVFKQTVQVAFKSGCVGLTLQAVDGTKIQAAGSSRKGWSKEYMEKLLQMLDAVVDKTEEQIEKANAHIQEAPEYRLPADLAQREALRQKIQAGLAQVKKDGLQHYHPVEPEARRMKTNSGTKPFAYNGQVVVDEQAGVVVACEVTQDVTDNAQLVPMIELARENVGPAASAQTVTLADGGYGAGAQLQAAAEQGLNVLVPPAEGGMKDGPYAARNFRYDPQARTVTCPQGQSLDYEGSTIKEEVKVERYRCHHLDCPVRALCTGDKKGREIEIRPYAAHVQQMRQRLAQPESAQLHRRRCQIVERCFGHIKEHDGFRRWTVWGLEAVQAQWAMVCATMNLRVLFKRWLANRTRPHNGSLAAAKPKGRTQHLRLKATKAGLQGQKAAKQPDGWENEPARRVIAHPWASEVVARSSWAWRPLQPLYVAPRV